MQRAQNKTLHSLTPSLNQSATALAKAARQLAAVMGSVAPLHQPTHSVAAPAIGLEAVLLLGVPDPEWGERLVALVRFGHPEQLAVLDRLTASWPAAERPRRWVLCDALAPNAAGKWERSRWLDWFRTL